MNKLEDNQTNMPLLFGTGKRGINMGKEMIRLKKFLPSSHYATIINNQNNTLMPIICRMKTGCNIGSCSESIALSPQVRSNWNVFISKGVTKRSAAEAWLVYTRSGYQSY